MLDTKTPKAPLFRLGRKPDPWTPPDWSRAQPDGTLSTQVTPPTRLVLRLIEGTVDPASGASAYHGATVSGQNTSYYDLVFVGNTGVTKIERP